MPQSARNQRSVWSRLPKKAIAVMQPAMIPARDRVPAMATSSSTQMSDKPA